MKLLQDLKESKDINKIKGIYKGFYKDSFTIVKYKVPATQAIENMNIMYGLDHKEGLA